MAFEVRVDCPSCPVEGTRIETWETATPSCRLGVPESSRCRLCGVVGVGQVVGLASLAPGDGCPGCGNALDEAAQQGGRCLVCDTHATLELTGEPRRFESRDELGRSLDAWAREEGLGSAEELVDAYFVLPNVMEIFAAMQRGERIETTFDVSDYLFSGGAGAGAGAATGGGMILREEEPPSTERVPVLRSLRPIGGPREELLAIASVAAADGEASADDQAVLARAAQKRGIATLGPHDVRVWRPNEIAPPATLQDRERVLEEMFQIGWADGQMDESELRVIRDFSRAWGIDPERLREWTELYSLGDSNAFERWFRRIGLFLFPAR